MNRFVVIVPCYNTAQYIDKCLNSILNQTYQNFELCVMDDCSTDTTWMVVNRTHRQRHNSFNVCRNDYRRGSALANVIKGMELFSFDKNDIIVVVDGDDWLSHSQVFAELNDAYTDPNVWLTYGQFIPASGAYPAYCKRIDDTRVYRKSRDWKASHLKTFKRGLFDKINDKDLRQVGGAYYNVANDASYMYPMIEMAGMNHIKFIEQVNYIYNDRNPINDSKCDRERQINTGIEIQNKPLYNEITSL